MATKTTMNDDPSPESKNPLKKLFCKYLQPLFGEPQNKTELVSVISNAEERQLIDPQTKEMLEGVIQVSGMKVRDIMIPRMQMVTIDINQCVDEFLSLVLESAHSRFPVVSENKDQVEGILLAKDLLHFSFNPDKSFVLSENLRDAVIVPESKRVDVLLKEFRQKRYHMAIVVDEYGGVSGLVTIEDILELIVGEIEDEFDDEPDEMDEIRPLNSSTYSVKALTSLEVFNSFFETDFDEDEADTIGGIVLNAFGRMPETDEKVTIGKLKFKVTNSDKRRINQLKVTIPE